MRIAIGGFAGLIGTALVQRLRKEGHDVVTLTRHEPIQPCLLYTSDAADE